MATITPAEKARIESEILALEQEQNAARERGAELDVQKINNLNTLRLALIQINQEAQKSVDWEKQMQEAYQKRLDALKLTQQYLQNEKIIGSDLEANETRRLNLKREIQKTENEVNIAAEELYEIERQIQKVQEETKNPTERAQKLKDLEIEREKLENVLRVKKLIADQEKDADEAGDEMFTKGLNLLGIQTEKQKLSFIEQVAAGKISAGRIAESAMEFATSGVAMRNIFASLSAKVVEMTLVMAKQLDTLRADAYKATGGMTDLGDQVMAASESAGMAGLSFEAMSKSYLSLIKNSSNFTELTKAQRAAVAANTAQLTQLGISADVASKNFSLFTQSLGMTAEQANASSRELVGLAQNLGMSFEQMANDFGQTATTFAAYGQGAVREFSKLAAESKALGISMQELISIVKGADTFEGAAQQAGKLNAMLGGGLLNSSQLLVASESERIQLIRDAVMQTGRSFETMSKYEQIAIANAAGIQDLTVAQKLFNQQISGSELDRYLGKTNALGVSQEQLQNNAAAARETTENLKIIMEQFAAAISPIVSVIAGVVGWFTKYSWIIKTLSTLIMAFIAVKVAYNAITAITIIRQNYQALSNLALAGTTGTLSMSQRAAAFTAAIFGRSQDAAALSAGRLALIIGAVLVVAFLALYLIMHRAGSPMLYAIFFFVAIGLLAMGESAEKTKKGLLAFGAAMMMVGIGAFLAFHGLEGFAIALSKLNPIQLGVLVIVIFALTFALLALFAGLGFLVYSGLGPAAAALLLAFGVSMLMAGAGAALLGLGLSLVVESLINLASNMAALIMLPIFLQLMAVSLIAVSIGLAIFTYTLINVGFAMMAAYIPILAVIGAITALSLAINSIAPEKSIALKATTESIRNFVDTGKQVTPEAIGNLDQVIKQIHKLNIEATISKAVNVTAPFKELIDAVKGQTAATAANKETTVVMKLNDREFGKAVVGVMNEYGTNNTSIRKPTPA